LEEEMKAMLERLIRESEEKEIARLTRMLEKRPARSLTKNLESTAEEMVSV